MKTVLENPLRLLATQTLCVVGLGMGQFPGLATAAQDSAARTRLAAEMTLVRTSAIPWSQIGTKAGKGYRGDGLAVGPTAEGAWLRCVFQRLEGAATREGMWLTSTATNAVNERFRVTATSVRREVRSVKREASACQSVEPLLCASRLNTPRLPDTGTVSVEGQRVRFTRPGLVEEYTVSMDGVRQDFVVQERPAGAGQLVVQLAVNGVRTEPAAFGTQMVLERSGRKIAYSRLRVTDAMGKELTARMEVREDDAIPLGLNDPGAELAGMTNFDGPAPALTIVVNDAQAVYPVRIDPTFSDANWVSMGGLLGANLAVYAVAVDGVGNLYIGGEFTMAGETIANYIARWDGNSWSALGAGMGGVPAPAVYALAVLGGDLYAGGDFTTAGGTAASYVAKWDGSNWSSLSSEVNGSVHALAVLGSDLYAGGEFTTAGSSSANYIARWDGSRWSALGSGMDNSVYALAVSGSTVYAGGYLSTAGGIAANSIAKWDGTSWTALGSGMDSDVLALAVLGSTVYAGGDFSTAGGTAASYVAQWDGTNWTALGSGPNSTVYALAVLGSDLYVGGYFPTAGGNPVSSIAQWDGTNWTDLAGGMGVVINPPSVYALTVSGGYLYAGGDFGSAGGNSANFIAQWDGNSWTGLGSSGLNGFVYALAVSGSDVYVAGHFNAAGGNPAENIVQWDGSNWTALGAGVDSTVHALAVLGSNVYAGGLFTSAGGIGANYVARWDGNNWTALDSGVGGDPLYTEVDALAVLGNNLIVGGDFTTAGVIAANAIAQWDGTNWTTLGSGMGDPFPSISVYVKALAVSGTNLYAGGTFTTAGGNAANSIAKWDGSRWTALGSGMDNDVLALAVSGTNLYAGGNFATAGGAAASYIAKWDGSSWSPLSSGVNGTVNALAVSGSELFAGGSFTNAGSNAANYITQWDGSAWTALGSGMNNEVLALAVSGGALYVGGGFTTAGRTVSTYVAQAQLPVPALSVRRSGTHVIVSWPSVDTTGFALEQAGSLTPATWVANTATVTDDGTNKSVTLTATNRSQFFRLHSP
jgi:hypothetical protein